MLEKSRSETEGRFQADVVWVRDQLRYVKPYPKKPKDVGKVLKNGHGLDR